MPTAKRKTPTVKEQLTKGLQDIEQRMESMFRDQIQDLTLNILREEVKKEVDHAYASREHAEKVNKEAKVESTASTLLLRSAKEYTFNAEIDGLVISEVVDHGKKDYLRPIMNAASNGALAFGFKSPKTVGYGSAHFRANYPSEAPIPSSGLHSTRGVIVEGDGDDEKTFTFRALSRQNRQGFNITGDGSVLVGDIKDPTLSRVHINQPNNDENVLNMYAGSKIFENTFLNIQSGKPANKDFKFFSSSVNVEQNGKSGIEVFKVDGEGSAFSDKGFFANSTGYAELFEWADGNKRNENRNGYTVSLNSKGQIVDATEGDTIIGVVCESAAVIGNTGWNMWQNTITKDSTGKEKVLRKKVVEWVDQTGILHSYYIDQLSKDFALPEEAIIYESDAYGDDITIKQINDKVNSEEDYVPRQNRGWALVALTGRVNVFKGQIMDSRWIKYCDVNDEIETWILR